MVCKPGLLLGYYHLEIGDVRWKPHEELSNFKQYNSLFAFAGRTMFIPAASYSSKGTKRERKWELAPQILNSIGYN